MHRFVCVFYRLARLCSLPFSYRIRCWRCIWAGRGIGGRRIAVEIQNRRVRHLASAIGCWKYYGWIDWNRISVPGFDKTNRCGKQLEIYVSRRCRTGIPVHLFTNQTKRTRGLGHRPKRGAHDRCQVRFLFIAFWRSRVAKVCIVRHAALHRGGHWCLGHRLHEP